MYIVCFLIFLGLLFLSFCCNVEGLFKISLIGTIIFLILILVGIVQIGTSHTIDEKIKVYKQENARIEESIELAIGNHMKNESEFLEKVKPENYVKIITMFPELNSNEFVMEKMKIHEDNYNQIKYLEVKKIDISKKKFLVYFGK